MNNVGWVLRRPKQFLEELLERLVRLMQSGGGADNNQELELVTQSLILLLENQTALCESLPTTGYINRSVASLQSVDTTISSSVAEPMPDFSESERSRR